MKQTPEQRAEARYQSHTEPDAMIGVRPWQLTRLAYATCIREEVEPLEAEVESLRALVQELVDRHAEVLWDCKNCDWSCECCSNDYGMEQTDLFSSATQALATAKSQGFVPTNTTEG